MTLGFLNPKGLHDVDILKGGSSVLESRDISHEDINLWTQERDVEVKASCHGM